MNFSTHRAARLRSHKNAITRAVLIASEPLERRTLLTGIPVTTTADTGLGSLRQAILDSNASVGVVDTITFSIGSGPQTIAPLTDLPLITDPVIIDGTTQPGYTNAPIIELSGASDPATAYGLEVDTAGGGTTIRGLVIDDFLKVGIILHSDNNLVAGNYIGTNTAGTAASANGGEGILIEQGSKNTIGGTTDADRNIISGNTLEGVNIEGLVIPAVTDQGGTVITPAQLVDATSNVVEGNYIGTDVTGKLPLGNGNDGITIFEATANTVGGTVAGAGNVISANGMDGIAISTATDDDNLGASGNLIEGNHIGTDVTGESASNLGNTDDGIDIAAGQNNKIGAAGLGRNIISGNGGNGISMTFDTDPLLGFVSADSNTIQNNYIGTNVDGTASLPNTGDGISISASSETLIGGSTAGLGNLISGNGVNGIEIASFDLILVGLISNGTTIQGNIIGLNAAGTAALPNNGIGIELEGTNEVTIGGTAAADRNVISGNGSDGIALVTVLADVSTSTLIQGNYIGVNGAGTAIIANTSDGIHSVGITGTMTDLTIGGTAAGAGNIISGNEIGVYFNSDQGDFVEGNWIGTNPAGANLGNRGGGVEIESSISVQVGGTNAGEANVIAFNDEAGVGLQGATDTTSNPIRANSIYSNTGLGIDLGDDGVTANDDAAFDADTGPNNLQNFPELTSATTQSGSTTFVASITSTLNTTLHIDFYSSSAADPSGFGEGQTYLGFGDVDTGATGTANFSIVLPVALTAGKVVTATATDPSGNTSEFSLAIPATIITPPPAKPAISINDVSMTEGNSGQKNFIFTVKLSKATSSVVTVFYATANGSAIAPGDFVAVPSTKLTFSANQTSKTITVKVNGDTTVEGNETFFVNLTSPTNATITDSQGKGTIQNDDVAPPTGTVSVVTDPCDSTKTALKFVGTSGNDIIVVTNASPNVQGKSIVTINGVNKGTFNFTGRILGYGGDGNDKITIDSHITRTAQIYGEAGNDTINGGSGNDLLFGGDGNDQLNGNAGRDILIGQLNNDSLNGGTGEDLLIAGSTNYDNNTEAWCDIQQEWFRTDLAYAARVNHIINGGGKNGSFKLNNSDVFSAAQQPDTLMGSTDNDLFYAASTGDKLTDKTSAETVVIVHA